MKVLFVSFLFVFAYACPFCDKEVLARQSFYEDDLVIVLYDYQPVFPGHSLIIPKRHVDRFDKLTEEEILQIGRVIKKVDRAVSKVFGTSSYVLIQRNGKEVAQGVFHVHVHYIPRKEKDDSQLKYFFNYFWRGVKGPIKTEDLVQIVSRLKDAIS